MLGTARSAEFRTLEGRQKAVLHLLQAGINHVVVIGGDGSLTGMAALYECWKECSGRILQEHCESAWFEKHWRGREEEARHLHAVGLIGSIDNDMAETDMTIGCDSALMRICDAIDQLSSTGNSHQREFVVEVMGRNCGWLALKAAIAAGADFCFFPEHPVAGAWAEELVSTIAANKARGRRSSIIVVSEGAVDEEFRPVKSHQVMQALCDAGFESRVTILGHVQRGGSPSSYDRVAVRHLPQRCRSSLSLSTFLSGSFFSLSLKFLPLSRGRRPFLSLYALLSPLSLQRTLSPLYLSSSTSFYLSLPPHSVKGAEIVGPAKPAFWPCQRLG